jgi:hypothetical protein
MAVTPNLAKAVMVVKAVMAAISLEYLQQSRLDSLRHPNQDMEAMAAPRARDRQVMETKGQMEMMEIMERVHSQP